MVRVVKQVSVGENDEVAEIEGRRSVRARHGRREEEHI